MLNCIIYPGTFDPITNGHIELIKRASRLFGRVVIAIAASSKKQTLFTLIERENMAREALASYHNVEVCFFTGLLIDLARSKEIMMVLRGLRAMSDFEYELQLSNINRMMEPKMETIFMASTEYSCLSSSMVREIALLGGDVSLFVPKAVQDALKEKLQA